MSFALQYTTNRLTKSNSIHNSQGAASNCHLSDTLEQLNIHSQEQLILQSQGSQGGEKEKGGNQIFKPLSTQERQGSILTQDMILVQSQDFATPSHSQQQIPFAEITISPKHKRQRFERQVSQSSELSQDQDALPQSQSGCDFLLRRGRIPKPTERAVSPPLFSNIFQKNQSLQNKSNTDKLSLVQWEDFDTHYGKMFKIIDTLGFGVFSIVHRVKHRLSGLEYAVKQSKKPLVRSSEHQIQVQEIQAWAHSSVPGCPHVVKYIHSWVSKANGNAKGNVYYIQLELCGKSLGAQLRNGKRFDEPQLVQIAIQMAKALHYLHSIGVAHLDVKPDNIYQSYDCDQTFKLGDLGRAASIHNNSFTVEEGDTRYLPQELLHGSYQQKNLDKCDMFSLGASLYELCRGQEIPNNEQIKTGLKKGKLQLMPHLTSQFQNLLKQLVNEDPDLRPNPTQMLNHKALSPSSTPCSSMHSHQSTTTSAITPPSHSKPSCAQSRPSEWRSVGGGGAHSQSKPSMGRLPLKVSTTPLYNNADL